MSAPSYTDELFTSIPRFDTMHARRLALTAWMNHPANSRKPVPSPNSVDRITVNYLRHTWTRYDDLRPRGFEQDVVAHGQLVAAVHEHISNLFPALRDECQRQNRQFLVKSRTRTSVEQLLSSISN